jgi:hypothetical protein
MKNFWLNHRNAQLKLESAKHEIQRLKKIVFFDMKEAFDGLDEAISMIPKKEFHEIQERVIDWRLAIEYSQNKEYYQFVSMLPKHLMANYFRRHWNGENFKGLGLIHADT